MNNLPIFVISLSEAAVRQSYMREHLTAHGLDFTLIDAVDGRQFDVASHPAHDTFRRRSFFGRDLKGGEVGCLLSHKKCFEKIVAEDISIALIFEDDVVLDENFTKILNAALQHKDSYDILRFIKKPKLLKKPHKNLFHLNDKHSICKTHGVPGGAYAYLITRTGAEKMLYQMEKNYLPVDTLMGQVWLTGARSYLVMPGVATVKDELGTMIGDERFDKKKLDASGVQKILYPLTRAGYKAYEMVMRAWQYYSPR